MSRLAVYALLAVGVVFGAGCKSDVLAPNISDNERQQARFDWNHDQFLLHENQQGILHGEGSPRELYETELQLADLEWRLGRLPFPDWHTRRRDSLVRLRDWLQGQRKSGGTTQLEIDRAGLRVQKERHALGEIGAGTWDRALADFRARLAEHARTSASSPGAAAGAEAAAMQQLDQELGS